MKIGRVTNTTNGVSVERILLTADEGMTLISPDGIMWNCVAADSSDGWTEIAEPIDNI